MKNCIKCKVNIENNVDNCPLCGAKIMDLSDDYNDDYPIIKRTFVYDLICQILLLFVIAGGIASLFLNRYIANEIPWSFIAIIGEIYIYFSVKAILRKNKNIPILILFQMALVGAVVIVIDNTLGWTGWSLNYVIPFEIIAGSVILTVISIFVPKRYKEYIFYIFIIAIIGVLCLIAVWQNWVTVEWPCIICVLYSTLTVLSMLIFSGRRFNNELKKRLHF